MGDYTDKLISWISPNYVLRDYTENLFHIGNGFRANRTKVEALGLAGSLERNSESEAFFAEAATAQVLVYS